MTKWEYDGSIHKFPVQLGEIWECEYGKLMCNDLYNGLPDFMLEADCVWSDPPWNKGNENTFRTKADMEHVTHPFSVFLDTFFAGIDAINPHTSFVVIGKQNVEAIEERLLARYPNVDIYPHTYYRKNACFLVRGGLEKATHDYSGMDEAYSVQKIIVQEPFNIIADPCIGRGALAFHAYKSQRRFAGTELNPKRLAVGINKIAQAGGGWKIQKRSISDG